MSLKAFSDHSDLVSRRMGFMPLPLAAVVIRVLASAVRLASPGGPFVFLLAYLCLLTFRSEENLRFALIGRYICIKRFFFAPSGC